MLREAPLREAWARVDPVRFVGDRLAVDFRAGAFFAVDCFAGAFFAVDFFAGARFAADFFAGAFFAVDFFAGAFFAGAFFAGARFAADFFAGAFFAVDFLAVDFLAGAFFAVDFLPAAFWAVDFLAGALVGVAVDPDRVLPDDLALDPPPARVRSERVPDRAGAPRFAADRAVAFFATAIVLLPRNPGRGAPMAPDGTTDQPRYTL